MKFCFLSSFAHLALDPSAERVSGGAELQVALLARELVKRGHEAVIIGGDIGQPESQEFDGVRTRNGGKFQTGAYGDLIKALPKVRSILREERPDFLLVLGWTTWLTMLHYIKGRSRLVFICGLDTEVNGEFRRENPVRGAVFEYGVRKADLRLAMSDYQAEQFKRQGLSCGLYRNLILPRLNRRSPRKRVDLLWVARCRQIKRPNLFLDLVERIPTANCEMICPPEDEDLWRFVEFRAKRLPNLRLLAQVPYSEIQDHYDQARIFVNTSTYEGWPNSFIQAGLGHAALASLEVNPDRLFERYKPGVHAEGDFEILVQQVTEMLNFSKKLIRAQAGCARFVHDLHDNRKNVDAFLESLGVR